MPSVRGSQRSGARRIGRGADSISATGRMPWVAQVISADIVTSSLPSTTGRRNGTRPRR